MKYSVRYDANKTSMHALALGPELTKAVTEIAQGALAVMKAEAESAMQWTDYDFYIMQWRFKVTEVADIPNRQKGEPMSRVAAQVWNMSDAARFAEVGNRDKRQHQGHRIFLHGLEWIEATHGDGNGVRRGTRDWGF
jgi:hypothetical protein